MSVTTAHLFPVFVRQGKSPTRFKVGYISEGGAVKIDPIFDEGTRFSEGLASVAIRNRWGIIDTVGNFVVQPKAWSCCRFREGLASICVNGKWGIIDRQGNFVVKPKYDYLEPFREGLALFRIGEGVQSRYGFVSKEGSEAIQPVLHDARGFSEGLAAAKVGNLWGYVAPSGVFKIAPRFDGSGKGKRWPDTRAGYFTNGLAPVWSDTDRYRFIDREGNFAFESVFDDANAFSEGLAVVGLKERFGFIDLKGQIAVACRFALARDFSEGLARVKEKQAGGKFASANGFISLDGQMAIRPAFKSAESFQHGLCLVATHDSVGYINKLGEFVWQGPYVEYGVVC